MTTRGFGRDSTADDVLDGIDCTGRVVLITGASGGLGAEAARALAAKGARVTITARDVVKGRHVVEEIRAATGNGAVDVMELELSSPASVRRLAGEYLARQPALHILI